MFVWIYTMWYKWKHTHFWRQKLKHEGSPLNVIVSDVSRSNENIFRWITRKTENSCMRGCWIVCGLLLFTFHKLSRFELEIPPKICWLSELQKSPVYSGLYGSSPSFSLCDHLPKLMYNRQKLIVYSRKETACLLSYTVCLRMNLVCQWVTH